MSIVQVLSQLKKEIPNQEEFTKRLIVEKLSNVFSDIKLEQVGYSEYQVEGLYKENTYLFEVYQQFRDDDYFPNHLVYCLREISHGEQKIETTVYFEHKDVLEQKLGLYLNEINNIKSEQELKHKQLVDAFALMEQDLQSFEGFNRIDNLLDAEKNLLEVPGLLRVKRMASNAFSILLTEYEIHHFLAFDQDTEKVKRSWTVIYESILMYKNKYKLNKTGTFNLFDLYEFACKHSRQSKIVEEQGPFSFIIKNIAVGNWDGVQANVSLFYHKEADRIFIHMECLGQEYNEEKELNEIMIFLDELFTTMK